VAWCGGDRLKSSTSEKQLKVFVVLLRNLSESTHLSNYF
jgi:hypothetical protein